MKHHHYVTALYYIFQDGIWGASINWSRTLVTYPCPPKYCNCVGDNSSDLNEGCQYLYDDENSLCATNRKGATDVSMAGRLYSREELAS